MNQSPTDSNAPNVASSQMEKENNRSPDEPLFSLSSPEPEKNKTSPPDKSPESNERFSMTLIKPLGDPVLEQGSPTIQEGKAVQSESSLETSPVDVVKMPTVLQDAPVFPSKPLVTSTPVSTNVNFEARFEPPSLLANFVHNSPGDRPSVQAGIVDQSNNVCHPMSKSPDHVSVDHAIATPKLEECSASVAASQPVQLEKPSAPIDESKAVEEKAPKADAPSKAKAPVKEDAHPAHEPAKTTTGQVREKAHPTAQAARKGATTTERKSRETKKSVPPVSGTRKEPPSTNVHPAVRENMRATTRTTTTKATSVANGSSETKSLPSKTAAVQPKKIVRRSEAKSAERARPSVAARQKLPVQSKSNVSASKPEIKNVQARVGSLENATHKPTTTGRVQIQSKKLDFSKTAKSKIGSLDNIKYKPAGGHVKIFEQKLNFKSKAHSKVAAENEKTTPSKSSEAVANETQNGSDAAVPATSVA